MMTNIEDRYKQVKEQEERLQFAQFGYADAWRLGGVVARKALERHLPILCEIRLNALQVFRFVNDGAKRHNALWAERKFNTVDLLQRSSLRAYLMPSVGEDDLFSELQHFDRRHYALLGGGFPIKLRGTGMIGAIAVSGLAHEDDHALVVESMEEFLDVQEEEMI